MEQEEVNKAEEPELATDAELSEVEKLTAELAEAKDKYLRLYSEFDNFRKRTAKEKGEMILNATEGLMKDLLPVLDDFQRAKEAMDKTDDVNTLREGTDLIYQKFLKVLESKGLKSLEAKDQPFDVELHECVTQFPAGDDKKGIVVDELEKGYFLNDKVIRYAKVVVGN
ncbi:nucleotide exchange factor GrpE [Leadbetterella sp. DM7]|uniref:nucleotide exchange factor GrpE n=1 Tax=Leadbetterella sp. DM7 TaxID=3235085 RepID=UPI00349ECFA0